MFGQLTANESEAQVSVPQEAVEAKPERVSLWIMSCSSSTTWP
jgi:hypothetical protein